MDELLFYGYEFLAEFVPFLIVLILFLQFNKDVKISPISNFFIIIFTLYIMAVYHFTGTGTIYEGLRYGLEIRNNFNIIPFSNEIDVEGYLLNILLLIPYGIFVPLIWEKLNKAHYIIIVGLAFSFLIESSQFLNIRASDIDDLILNTLGAVIGFMIYRLADKITKSKYEQKNAPPIMLILSVLVPFIGRFLLYNDMALAKLIYGF